MVRPEDREPLLHDPNGSGIIGRQGSESIDDYDGRAEVCSCVKLSVIISFDAPLHAASQHFAHNTCFLQVIYVPEGFEVREGIKLSKDYQVLDSTTSLLMLSEACDCCSWTVHQAVQFCGHLLAT